MNLPEFTVLRTSSPRALGADPEWTADTSQPTDGSGNAIYRIFGSCSDGTIPVVTVFIVRVYDALSRTYSFSRRRVLDRGGQEHRGLG